MTDAAYAPRALITGGAKRLGRAMALYLAKRGYDLVIHYARSGAEADALVAEIRAMGQQAVALQADLTQEAEAQALFPAATAALGGPITCLINNASVFEYDNLKTATRESWDRHLDSNLRAPFVLIQKMAEQGLLAAEDELGEPQATGLVVNMADMRVRKLSPEFMSYTLAKTGLWTLTQTAAQALAPHIRVNAIGPGPTLIGSRQSEAHFQGQRRNTVLKRGSNPADIVGALAYFLDAPGVTGQILMTDGGQHLGWQTPDVRGVEKP